VSGCTYVLHVASPFPAAFNEGAGDLERMFLYFRSGRYVADNTLHEELLGPVPTGEDAVRRWAKEKNLIAG
jgi:hypothetical protein